MALESERSRLGDGEKNNTGLYYTKTREPRVSQTWKLTDVSVKPAKSRSDKSYTNIAAIR